VLRPFLVHRSRLWPGVRERSEALGAQARPRPVGVRVRRVWLFDNFGKASECLIRYFSRLSRIIGAETFATQDHPHNRARLHLPSPWLSGHVQEQVQPLHPQVDAHGTSIRMPSVPEEISILHLDQGPHGHAYRVERFETVCVRLLRPTICSATG
jgi:hypothetical protein